MKRPLLVLGLGVVLTTWASFFLDAAALPVLMLLCLTAALPLYVLRERRGAFVLMAVLLSMSVAFGLRWHHQRTRVDPLLRMDGKSVTVEGVVTQMSPRVDSVDYIALVNFPGQEALPDRSYLALRSLGGVELLPGDAFVCDLRISEFPTSSNYNRSRGAFVRGYVIVDSLRLTPTGPYEFTRLAVNLREGMAARLRARLDADTAALLEGMLLGQSANLSDETSLALSRSGVGHLLAVSGLHLGILTGLLTGLLARVGCPRRLRCLAAVLFGFGFSAMVGFSASVFRAFVMLSVHQLATALPTRDRSDSLSSLGLSLLLVSVFAPHWTLSNGIWLSAGSTAGIALYSGRVQGGLERLFPPSDSRARRLAQPFLSSVAVSVAAYLCCVPVLVFTSGWVPLAAPLVNLLLMPLIPVVLGLGVLLGALPLSVPLGALAGAVQVCGKLLVRVAGMFASLRLAVFPVDRLDRLVWVAGALALAYLLLHWRAARGLWRWSAAAVSLVLVLGSLTFQASAAGRVEVVSIEHCSQVILLRDDEAVLIGTPDQYEIGYLLRYFEYRGVRSLRAVVATDCPDQVGSGLRRLAARCEVERAFAPADPYIVAQLEAVLPGVEVAPAGEGAQFLFLDGVRVDSTGGGHVMTIQAGSREIVRLSQVTDADQLWLYEDYTGPGVSLVLGDGSFYWAADAPPRPEPLGALLFGETRLVIGV